MPMTSPRGIILMLGVIGALEGSHSAHAEGDARPSVQLRFSAFDDLHHWVRSVHDDRAEPWEHDRFAAALENLGAVKEHVRHPLDLGPLDVLVLHSVDPAVAIESAGDLATPRGLRSDADAYREAAREYLRSLKAMLAEFEAGPWPARRAALEETEAWLEETFIARSEVLEWHSEALGLALPDPPVTLTLVTRTGWPGGFTYNDGNDRGVSYVALSLQPRSLLFETVLHELTHAMEVQRPDQSVPSRIRAGLREAGLPARDTALRSGWHTIYFIQSAMTTQRWLDEDHVPYGEARGLYERTGPIAEIELRAWEAHRAGQLTTDEAIDRIVSEIAELMDSAGE